jgi:hypothetical protein
MGPSAISVCNAPCHFTPSRDYAATVSTVGMAATNVKKGGGLYLQRHLSGEPERVGDSTC